MGMFDFLRRERPPEETRDDLENPSVPVSEALTGMDEYGLASGGSASGVTVTPEKALRMTAVYSCVRIIAESVASLPFPVRRKDGRSRVPVSDDPRHLLLNQSPNPEQTAFEFWEMELGHLNLWGNSYAFIDGSRIETAALWPLRPDRTYPDRDSNRRRIYRTLLDNGEWRVIPADRMMHLRAFSTGDVGLSPIALARQAVGLAQAAEEYGAALFSNGAMPGGLIKVPGKMDDDQQRLLQRQWNAGHQGLKRSHLVGILTGGAGWESVGIPPEDAQFLETRKFEVREIARVFRVPPYMIADLEAGSVSYASVEQQAIDFVVHSLRPWLVRVEQRVQRALFNGPDSVAAGLYPQFKVEGLLRGDTKSRFEAYAIGRQWGWLSINDVRELEDLTTIEGGDEYLQPLNMSPLGAPPEDLAQRIALLQGAVVAIKNGQPPVAALAAGNGHADA